MSLYLHGSMQISIHAKFTLCTKPSPVSSLSSSLYSSLHSCSSLHPVWSPRPELKCCAVKWSDELIELDVKVMMKFLAVGLSMDLDRFTPRVALYIIPVKIFGYLFLCCVSSNPPFITLFLFMMLPDLYLTCVSFPHIRFTSILSVLPKIIVKLNLKLFMNSLWPWTDQAASLLPDLHPVPQLHWNKSGKRLKILEWKLEHVSQVSFHSRWTEGQGDEHVQHDRSHNVPSSARHIRDWMEKKTCMWNKCVKLNAQVLVSLQKNEVSRDDSVGFHVIQFISHLTQHHDPQDLL